MEFEDLGEGVRVKSGGVGVRNLGNYRNLGVWGCAYWERG